ncbi:MAG: alpha-galactosidase, partial [Thermoanaerobaculia bacterium]|nr:alpha-galactosidase [Thermoanaerobaculia bacterium]
MTMQRALLEIESDLGPKTYDLNLRGGNSFDELYVDFQLISEQDGERYSVFLHPKQDLVVKRLEIRFAVEASPDARFFANGYQSWSESRLWATDAALPRLRAIAKQWMGRYGDDWIGGISNKGLHSWTYTYLPGQHENVRFWGSLNESTGFTLFLFDAATGGLTVRKDLENLRLSHSFPALDFWTGEGDEATVFDAWVKRTGSSLKKNMDQIATNTLNWTSWYRYFDHISEDIILKNLESVADSGLPFRYFQIDDGWQNATGDWRSVKPDFPGGMGLLANKIREKGLHPGLWLAPFVASGRSQLVKKNPEWLLKGPNGKPLRAGWNPVWGGWFYALNFYHPAVQDYLSGVFHVVLDQWGYAMVKLDFLFAACLAPPPGKTRGQAMHDALEFLRRQLGGRTMLACGVPLGSAFGLADICRIGGDVHLKWEHRLLSFL